MGGVCGKHGEKRNACNVFVRKPKGKRSHRIRRRKRKDKIKVVLKM